MFAKLFRRSPEKQVIVWITKLDLLLATDAPIMMALNNLSLDPDVSRLKPVTEDICSRVYSGWTLSEALAKHTAVFGSLHLYVMTAEAMGTVPATLRRLAVAYAQLHALSIPVGLRYVPEEYGVGDAGALYQPVTWPANVEVEPTDQLLSLFGEVLPGHYVVITQDLKTGTCSCTEYTASGAAGSAPKKLSWDKGRHLMYQVLMMANLNYWDKSKLTSSILMRRGTSNTGFTVQRAYDDMGMMTLTITVVSSEQVA